MTYVTWLLVLAGLSLAVLVWDLTEYLYMARRSSVAREQLDWWAGS